MHYNCLFYNWIINTVSASVKIIRPFRAKAHGIDEDERQGTLIFSKIKNKQHHTML